jgi:hypothetical protein
MNGIPRIRRIADIPAGLPESGSGIAIGSVNGQVFVALAHFP